MAVVLFMSVGSIFLVHYISKLRTQIKSDTEELSRQICTQFCFITDNMNMLSTDVLSDSSFLTAASRLGSGTLTGVDEQDTYRKIKLIITNYPIVSSVYHISFFNDAGYIIQSDMYNEQNTENTRLPDTFFSENRWIERARTNLGRTVLLPVQQSPFSRQEDKSLMLVRVARNPGNTIGYLSVEIYLKDIISSMNYSNQYASDICIRNSNGETLFSFGSDRNRNSISLINAVCNDEKHGISVLVTTSVGAVFLRSMHFILVFLATGLFFAALTMFSVVHMSGKITRPLAVIADRMKVTDYGKFLQLSDIKEISNCYETDILIEAYENMSRRISQMVDREIVWQTQQTEQRIETLQAQINPHFMYNTLSMIGILGLENNNKKVFEACSGMSNLLRYSMTGKNGNLSTIGDEFRNLRDYLALMKMRFEDSVLYEIIEDSRIAGVKIPRLSLQPLVENIFDHAFDSNTGCVRITVRSETGDHFWKITVLDDGCGVSEEKLRQIRDSVSSFVSQSGEKPVSSVNTGMGLGNTISRLCMYYGDSFSYRLENASPGFMVVFEKKESE